ncbi:unnamed protein product [Arabidopsis arenosa]|uniref:Strictosidine synthase conserved region domain-containing protein n=1 Tax=Arabidopsis arenosa TaxID=38785 RepID=A0A8S2AUY6_ARAAE|nr:unnamed protein product [Arabidopsis arenosa]
MALFLSPKAITLLFFSLSLALYCSIDPFHHCAISDFPNFVSHEVVSPRPDEVPWERDSQNSLQKSKILFLNQVQGPESVAFDSLGRGPYTGVADGRVLFWNGQKWIDFAYTSSNRSEICDPKPSALSYLRNEHICGRPLGLRFDKRTGDLYIADAYMGLLKVDSSINYQRRNFLQLVFSGDNTGRVLKYDPIAKKAVVLVSNLQFPNGVSISKDGSFFVFCEGDIGSLRRYWLKGEKAGTTDVFAFLPGHPDNLRMFILRLPITARTHYSFQIGLRPHGLVVKYSPEGKLMQVLEDSEGKVVRSVSEVEEKDGKLWLGSVLMNFVAVYDL